MKWMVIVTGSQKIEELRRAPDEILSMRRALAEVVYYISQCHQN